MKRILGIDFGLARIGIALSDPLMLTAQPLPYIKNTKDVGKEFQNLIETYMINDVVVGLPRHLDGNESDMTQTVREFVEKILKPLQMNVIYRDERFSSKAVERFLVEANVSRKKRKEVIDSGSAVFVLQGYLDQENNKLEKENGL